MKIQLLFFVLLFWVAAAGQELDKIATQKPFEFSGTFTLYGSHYHVDGIAARRKDFSWYLTGNPNFKIYGIEIPFSFTVSEQERSFRQPFNQFCVSPSYKWAKAHLGYTNLTWSPFTWAGQTALGAGIELSPGKFRFGFLYGRINRAVEEDVTAVEPVTPAFKRTGYAARIGYGTETSHLDFIFLKAKDDANSLDSIPKQTVILPAENAVLGLSSKLKFSEHFFWDVDLAASVVTRDIRATPLSDDDEGLANNFRSVLNVNTSTNLYNAVQTEFGFVNKTMKIKAKYKRVEPDFQSMGAYYFQTDVENITLEPSFTLAKSKLRINSSIGQQRDNILHQKSFTSKRLIGNLAVDLTLGKFFGINALYTNYSSDQSKGLKVPNETLKQTYISQNMMLAPRFTFMKEKISHFHILMANRQWMQDRNATTAPQTEYQVDNLNYTGSLVFNQSALTLSGSYLLTVFDANTNSNRLNGFSLSANKALFNNKLNSGISGSYTMHELNSAPFATILNLSSQHNYALTQHHGIALQFNFLSNQAKVVGTDSFTEYNIDLGYTYTF
ncbi:MAG TPA: hypothetical protein PLS51_07360 [Flavobacterium sp.]|nr:hypothetical protein [Flavobacterium sp.]HPJ10430.1 hypothetical protein [Flavobacterium sp.]